MATTAEQVAALQKQNNEMYIQSAREQMQFQERMSNTAHQREVSDLLKAGLNPVLSATGGQGATTPNGAQADVDASSMVNFLLNEMNNENARTMNNAQVAAQRYAAQMAYQAAQVQANAQIRIAEINASTKPWYAVAEALGGENNIVKKAINKVQGFLGINWTKDGIKIGSAANEFTVLGWLKSHWNYAMANTPSWKEYNNLVEKRLRELHYNQALSWLQSQARHAGSSK